MKAERMESTTTTIAGIILNIFTIVIIGSLIIA